ncbi:MAG: sensor histidine kinase [Ignavibacteriales bacterium]|nr:sensor histidine kinase [Ignavibacteriales bacterium]MBK7979545.1 sensor histidine kinase [Ignavibacteriota bacterium]
MKNLFVILLVITSIVISLFLSYLLYQEFEERTLLIYDEQQKIFLTQLSVSIENNFGEITKSLEYFSKKENIVDLNDGMKREFQNYYESHYNEIYGITRVSEFGKIIYTFPFIDSVINADVSAQEHNKKIMSNFKPVISEPFTSLQGNKTIAIAYPIFKNGKYKGSISLLIKFDNLIDNFVNPIIGLKDFTGVILSKNGEEIYFTKSNNSKNIDDNLIEIADIKRKINDLVNGDIQKFNFSIFTSKLSGIEKQYAFNKINLGNTFWIVGSSFDLINVLQINRSFALKLTLIFFTVVLFFSVLAYLFFKSERKNAKLLKNKDEKYKIELENIVEKRTNDLNNLNKSLEEDLQLRKQIEKQLISAIDKAEKSEKIKTDFLAQMSHEIRTPINTILSFSNLIKDEMIDKVSDELKYGFGGINRASKRLIRTIDLILNMADVQAGTHEYIPNKFDIAVLLRKILDEYKDQILEKELIIKFHNNVKSSELISDVYSVEQIFSNIIDNAVKFTAKGSIEIVIDKSENNFLFVSITDTGIGITEEYLPKIFNEFSQEDMGYTRKYEGNGLGLALVKKYCELNNAVITVISKKDFGSAFTVTFLKSELQKDMGKEKISV